MMTKNNYDKNDNHKIYTNNDNPINDKNNKYAQ